MSNGRLQPFFPASLVLALFVCLCVLSGRSSFCEEGAPAFFVAEKAPGWVELGAGFKSPGVRQLFDKQTPGDVMKLTNGGEGSSALCDNPEWRTLLISGERLDIDKNSRRNRCLRRSWMSASTRMTLGVPLHPDKMGLADWTALPGIGPKLAERIEIYRQKNGDFGRLKALQSVPGIGPKRIEVWRVFFDVAN